VNARRSMLLAALVAAAAVASAWVQFMLAPRFLS
jgi:hypothetical protein